MSVNVRTTINPSVVITVSDQEYADLLALKLIYSVEGGTPIVRPFFTPEQYADLSTRYRSVGDYVRLTQGGLAKWEKARLLASLGQAPARILCIGDSTTAGVYSDSYTTAIGSTNQGGPNSYPSRLAAELTAMGIPASVGMAIPGRPGNDDSRWTGQGAKIYGGAGIGAGYNASLQFAKAGDVGTLTPGVKADTYVIYYFGDAGTGTLSVQATGGAASSVNTARNPAAIATVTVKAGTASAANALTISWVSGTSFILGVEFFDSTAPNTIRVLPAGVGSSTSGNWNSNVNVFGPRGFIRAVAPDLGIISLGINDMNSGAFASDVMTNVRAIAGDVALSGSVLLASAFPHASPSSLDDVNSLYRASEFPYVDLAARYGYQMVARGLMTVDQTHPNALGYADAAVAIAYAVARR